MYGSILLSAAALASSVAAQSKGFNYGATDADGSCRGYENYAWMFSRARGLNNADGFTSARLYTTIQCGSQNAPIEALKAAIDSETDLLMGMWASAGQESFNQELAALSQAVDNWGPALRARVVGISVGSEDLYRSSPEGVQVDAGVGATSDEIVRYIGQVREALQGTPLADVQVGHVDTWTAWVAPENSNVAQAVDFLGHNSFPYYENTKPNAIEAAADLFNTALSNTEGAANGKPVWVTETGWPTRGDQSNEAIASVDNSKTYWNQVGCQLFGNRNVWWYTLFDANTAQTDLSFAVAQTEGQKFDTGCPN